LVILDEYHKGREKKMWGILKNKAPHHYLWRTNYAFNVPSKYNKKIYAGALSVSFGGHKLRVQGCAY
jgi:hypothetical protein